LQLCPVDFRETVRFRCFCLYLAEWTS
jgi:hypothetical protein